MKDFIVAVAFIALGVFLAVMVFNLRSPAERLMKNATDDLSDLISTTSAITFNIDNIDGITA